MSITLNHPYGSISVYENYVISIINEGVTVTSKINDTILDLINPHFGNRKFIYIAHRKYSYAVDPTVYNHISKIQSLKAIAVVSSNRIALNNAELEKIFTDKPFETFYDIEDAKKWAISLMKDNCR